jgi:hypothetical protein
MTNIYFGNSKKCKEATRWFPLCSGLNLIEAPEKIKTIYNIRSITRTPIWRRLSQSNVLLVCATVFFYMERVASSSKLYSSVNTYIKSMSLYFTLRHFFSTLLLRRLRRWKQCKVKCYHRQYIAVNGHRNQGYVGIVLFLVDCTVLNSGLVIQVFILII